MSAQDRAEEIVAASEGRERATGLWRTRQRGPRGVVRTRVIAVRGAIAVAIGVRRAAAALAGNFLDGIGSAQVLFAHVPIASGAAHVEPQARDSGDQCAVFVASESTVVGLSERDVP